MKLSPVFIVGMNGSGTSLLLKIIGRHSKLYGFPRETRIIPYYIKTLNKYGDLEIDSNFYRLLSDIKESACFSFTNKRKPIQLPSNWRDLPRTLESAFDTIFQYFALKENKKRWCEKTPMHANHIQSLSNVFQNALFIHIVRDGRDVSASFNKRWKHNPYCTIYRWKRLVKESQQQGKRIKGRYIELTYEDLTKNSENVIRRLCNFIGLKFEDTMIKPSSGKLLSFAKGTYSESEGIESNSGGWLSYFSSSQQRRLEEIAGSTLELFKYKLKYQGMEKKDDDLSNLLFKYWLFKGYISNGILEIFRKIINKSDVPWWHFPQQWIQTIRQRHTTKM